MILVKSLVAPPPPPSSLELITRLFASELSKFPFPHFTEVVFLKLVIIVAGREAGAEAVFEEMFLGFYNKRNVID